MALLPIIVFRTDANEQFSHVLPAPSAASENGCAWVARRKATYLLLLQVEWDPSAEILVKAPLLRRALYRAK